MSERYREWVRTTVERPTEAQMRTFAPWLSEDHSWYKHLRCTALVSLSSSSMLPTCARSSSSVQAAREAGVASSTTHTWIGNRLTLDLRPGDELPDLVGTAHSIVTSASPL